VTAENPHKKDPIKPILFEKRQSKPVIEVEEDFSFLLASMRARSLLVLQQAHLSEVWHRYAM
jgi:hypothetical protein